MPNALIKTLFVSVYCFCGCVLYAQTHRVDSLQQLFRTTSSDATRLKAILDICEEYQSISKDTLYEYATVARELALKTGDPASKTLAELALANSYLRWGWMDSALATLTPELKKYTAENARTRELHFKLLRQKALAYGMRSDFENALRDLYTLVAEAEKYHDSLVLSANMNTIGSVAIARNKFDEAVGWFRKALAFADGSQKFSQTVAAIYTNMANAFFSMKRADSARHYIDLALDEARRAENLNTYATALRVESAIAMAADKMDEAEKALMQMIDIRAKTNDPIILLDENMQLVDFYMTTHQFQKAIDYCRARLITGNLYQEGKDSGKVFVNNIHIRLPYTEALARAYKAAGQNDLYQQTLEQIIATKDSAVEATSAEAIAEMQTRYEVQKKENTIIQQKLDLTRKNYILYGSLLVASLLVVIAMVIFRDYRRKQKVKLARVQEEERRMAVQAVRDAEEKERRRIAEDLHDNLGAYAASISSNLDYLHLPDADNASRSAIEGLRTNARSIVSQLNDTIWALNKESLTLTEISDRTKLFLQRIMPSYPAMRMEVLENIRNDRQLLPYQAFHLFQIVQEAVTNALKHSGADRIVVTIDSADEWRVGISDNGKGFNGQQGRPAGGNGLRNMKARAAKAGWNIEWTPDGGVGTLVSIRPTSN